MYTNKKSIIFKIFGLSHRILRKKILIYVHNIHNVNNLKYSKHICNYLRPDKVKMVAFKNLSDLSNRSHQIYISSGFFFAIWLISISQNHTSFIIVQPFVLFETHYQPLASSSVFELVFFFRKFVLICGFKTDNGWLPGLRCFCFIYLWIHPTGKTTIFSIPWQLCSMVVPVDSSFNCIYQ